MLRKFDLESNSVSRLVGSFTEAQLYTIHTISLPPILRHPIAVADTFTWRNRETVAVVTGKSIWVGWRRDTQCTHLKTNKGTSADCSVPRSRALEPRSNQTNHRHAGLRVATRDLRGDACSFQPQRDDTDIRA